MLKSLKNTNWTLLRKQKLTLLRMIDRPEFIEHFARDDYNAINGVVSLIDGIQNDVVDTGMLSSKKVFGFGSSKPKVKTALSTFRGI